MPRSQPKGGRVHPARSSPEALAEHLGVDLDSGLSPKEVTRRLEAEQPRPLFVKDGRRMRDCLKMAFREPVLWILLAVSVVALFFDRVALGVSCLLLVLLNGGICAWAHHYAERVDMAMQTYDAPLSRVLRNRRVWRVPAEGIVRGDVILLYPGDIVPADVRLLSSNDLAVSEYALDGDGRGERLFLPKDAAATPDQMPRRHSPDNMVFAGAVVERGQARALVIEVGMRTHLGARTGGISPAQTVRTPVAYRRARKYISLWNLLLAFVIVPVTAIGIFTLGSRFDLFDLFLTSLALAVVSLTEHLMAQGLFMGAWVRANAASARDTDNAVDIKTSVAAEAMTAMTHLVVVGTAGWHDGMLRPDSVTAGGQAYTLPTADADRAASSFSQKLYLWKKAMTDQGGLPREEEAALFYAIDEINRWADPDPAALEVRVKRMVAQWGEVTVTLQDGHILYLRLTADFADVDACERVAGAQGVIPFDGTRRYEWYRAYGDALHGGRQAFFLVSEADGVSCAEGMITLSTHICRKTLGCIRDLEDAGICVTAFLRNASAENIRVLDACGLTSKAPVDRPSVTGERAPAYTAVQGGMRAFEGCDTAFIRQYIEDVRAAGGCVGVLSADAEDLPLLDAADIAITCAPDLFTATMKGEIPRVTADEALPGADGTSRSACATDLMRRRAHVLVRRGNIHGGGVCAVRGALLTATRFGRGLRRSVRFIFLSHFLRLVAVLLPVVCGLTLLSAPAVLISGLIVDLLAVLCYTVGEQPLSPDDPSRGGLTRGLTKLHITYRRDLVAVGVAAILPWISVAAGTWANHNFGASTAYIGYLSLISIQLILLWTGRPSRRNRMTFAVTLTLVCLYVAGLAVALGAGLHPLWSLIWPLLSPIGYLATYGIFALYDRANAASSVK